jgi:hypothetical protein
VTRSIRVILACLTVTFLHANRAAAAEAFFDYLYIEASSGSSAGGHAAVRFGEDVYHFQHGEPGIIRPAVQTWASFDLSYRGIENRPIHVQRIAVSPRTYERLRSGFHRRYVVQESHVRLLEAVRREDELLSCFSQHEPHRFTSCGVRLPGAGYFAAERPALGGFPDSEPPHSANLDRAAVAIEQARRSVERAYGDDYLERRIQDLRSQIEGLRPNPVFIEPLRDDLVSVPPRLFVDTYRDLLLELAALRVLTGQALPDARAFRVLPVALTGAQSASLRRREVRTRETIVPLLRSMRQDRGYPLLVALARLIAFRASRESGTLTVLDTYAEDAPTASLIALRQLPALWEIREERRQEMRDALASALAAEPDDEASWSRFEVAANVALELEEAVAGGRPLRSHQPTLVPGRGARSQSGWPVPELGSAAAAPAVDRTKRQERQIEEQLLDLYRYDLIRRNCVTEIFRTTDGSEVELGERVDFAGNANFIPFVSAEAVHESYPVIKRVVLPSYRQQQLRRLRTAPGSWRTLLRESTSVTSTVIPFDIGAEAFLFFSSETVLLRPLLGTANVAFGSGAILLGALTAPFDQGNLLAAGARGVFYSLPEVAFVNIRKGTVPLLASTWDTASP